MNLIATSFGDGDVLLWMFEFFLFFIWFWLLDHHLHRHLP